MKSGPIWKEPRASALCQSCFHPAYNHQGMTGACAEIHPFHYGDCQCDRFAARITKPPAPLISFTEYLRAARKFLEAEKQELRWLKRTRRTLGSRHRMGRLCHWSRRKWKWDRIIVAFYEQQTADGLFVPCSRFLWYRLAEAWAARGEGKYADRLQRKRRR